MEGEGKGEWGVDRREGWEGRDHLKPMSRSAGGGLYLRTLVGGGSMRKVLELKSPSLTAGIIPTDSRRETTGQSTAKTIKASFF